METLFYLAIIMTACSGTATLLCLVATLCCPNDWEE